MKEGGILRAGRMAAMGWLLSTGLLHGAGHTWTGLTNAPNKAWQAVASSADGIKLIAAVYGGGLYTSTNSGLTWVSNAAPVRNWYSVVSSADGSRLAAAVQNSGGEIWNSTNAGGSWNLTPAPSGATQFYQALACSSNGMRLVAAGTTLPTRRIYTSADGGVTWNITSAPNASWYSVAASGDGTKLVGMAWNTNVIYTSTDFGTNWASHAIPSNPWFWTSSSADGNRLLAVVNGGGVFTSTNSGATWISNSVPSRTWYSCASSYDGSKLAVAGIGAIYTSVDGGQSWISNSVVATLSRSVASSADGNRLLATLATGPDSGFLYSGVLQTPTPVMTCKLSAGGLSINWPASATGFQLQQNVGLTAAGWLDVTNAVTQSNSLFTVTLPYTNSRTFYRLKGQ